MSIMNLSSPPRRGLALAIGLVSAYLFISLCQFNLSAQGLYYDELHQGPAAFPYAGLAPQTHFFSSAFLFDKPLLTTGYAGAFKPAIYGLYLRSTRASFTPESWRWLGILMVAVTFPIFALMARTRLSTGGLLLFFALLLTDTTVLLETRHDWGPVALSLGLRIVLLGTWLYGQKEGGVRTSNSFWLGLLVGISIYEKLSNLVLIPPLVMFLLCGDRRNWKHWSACVAGGLVGMMPVFLANCLSYRQVGQCLSLAHVAAQGDKSLGALVNLLTEYVSLGGGTLVRMFVLGDHIPTAYGEGILMGAALIAVACMTGTRAVGRAPAILIAGYLGIAIGLFLLPNQTSFHHWVIGTPFQYLAVAMAINPFASTRIRFPRLATMSRAVLLGILCLLFVVRTQATLDVMGSLARGSASPGYDPSFTKLAEFAARRAGQDLFVVGNWGVGTQIFCMANGHPDVVREVFQWPPFPPLETVLDLKRFRSFYVVLKVPHDYPDPEITRKVILAIEQNPNLRETSIESELADLKGLKIRRFVPVQPTSVIPLARPLK